MKDLQSHLGPPRSLDEPSRPQGTTGDRDVWKKLGTKSFLGPGFPRGKLGQFEEGISMEVVLDSLFSQGAAEGWRRPAQVLSAGYSARNSHSVKSLWLRGGVGTVKRECLLKRPENVGKDWSLGSLGVPALPDQCLWDEGERGHGISIVLCMGPIHTHCYLLLVN
ncbi:hypothetical protein E2C01_017264 [Portunus trituberculatus]|uniref:Uncharacterized protein n=1 Tax=Portunus trituberculatus TaxID=210409 RepID=A0A5B7DS07_PORTR|nr:hypothetical protein [Portunus trituberculatus]